MRNLGLIAAGVAGAIALAGVGFAIGTSGTNPPSSVAESSAQPGEKVVKVASNNGDNARVAAAERRAVEAERAAAAKIQCEKERQNASNTGAVVGGVAGAVIGSQVAGSGAKSEGGAIGAVTGVLAGRQIAKKDHRC